MLKIITDKFFRVLLSCFRVVSCMVLLLIPSYLALAGPQPASRPKTSGLDIGDPIAANTGGFYWEKELLNLGGPVPLAVNIQSYMNDPTWHAFGFSPQNTLTYQHPIMTVEFGNRVERPTLSFDEGRQIWRETEDSRSGRNHVMRETSGYYYLHDPHTDDVWIFEKHDAPDARLKWRMDRNGNRLTWTYATPEETFPGSVFEQDEGLGHRKVIVTRTQLEPWVYLVTLRERILVDGQEQDGRAVSVRYGATEMTAHSVHWQPTVVTDALGGQTILNWDTVGGWRYVSSITLPRGNTPFSQVAAYTSHWDGSPQLLVTSQTDAYGNTTTLTHPDHATIRENRPDGAGVTYSGTKYAPQESWIDAAGKGAAFTMDSAYRLTSMTDRLGDATTLTYHAPTGRIASLTNAAGRRVDFTYTAQEQAVVNPANAEQVTLTFFNLTRVDYPDGAFETFTHDARGNVLSHTDRDGQTWTFTSNERGLVLTAVNPAGGEIAVTYNADATVATVTDSDTGTTTYGYDASKRLTHVTWPDAGTVLAGYDHNDRITSVTDERGKTYAFDHDANGNLTVLTHPDNSRMQFSYDLLDRMIEATDSRSKKTEYRYDVVGRLQSVSDPNGNTLRYGYNTRDWLEKITDGLGREWRTGHDDEALPVTRTTPLGRATMMSRDALGHLLAVRDPLHQETAMLRDEMSRVTAITDPLRRQTSFAYDPAGRLIGVTRPANGSVQYRRNSLGLVDRITDFKGSQWSLSYTRMGRLAGLADPLNNQWSYSHDTRGRLSRITYPDASTQTLTRDEAGNVVRRFYSSGPDLNFTYDDRNRLLSANDIAFTYNETGQVTATTVAGTAFGATYDDGGRIRTATYDNDQFRVTYTYDARNLLTKVTDSLTNTTIDFSRDSDGRLTVLTRANGVNTTFTWDNASRLTRIRHGSLADLRYGYNAAGETAELVSTVPLDPADQQAPAAAVFTFDAASQVSSVGYAYDVQGRRTAMPGQTFTWDGASRLTAANDTVLTYNGLNDLLTRQSGGVTTRYFPNYALGLQPIVAEYNVATGAYKRFYVLTPDGQLLYAVDAADNAVHFYHFDAMGNTLFLTNAAGQITDSYAYSPFGTLLARTGSSDQPFTFVGAWQVRQENANGLYQMRARYYDAHTASFLTREPLWPTLYEPMGLNPYQYAYQNPLRYIDADGEARDVARSGYPAILNSKERMQFLDKRGYPVAGMNIGILSENQYNIDNLLMLNQSIVVPGTLDNIMPDKRETLQKIFSKNSCQVYHCADYAKIISDLYSKDLHNKIADMNQKLKNLENILATGAARLHVEFEKQDIKEQLLILQHQIDGKKISLKETPIRHLRFLMNNDF